MKIAFGLSVLCALVSVSACSDTGDEIPTPSFVGKGDSPGGTEDMGTLRFGGERTASFTQNLEFHSYSFTLGERRAIAIEVPTQGSDADLPATLFLYGPALPSNGFGLLGDSIAIDDGSQGDSLKLAGIEMVLEPGDYMVVVGKASITGRGDYRLTLECTDGACEVEASLCSHLPKTVGGMMFDGFVSANTYDIFGFGALDEVQLQQVFDTAVQLGKVDGSASFDDVFEIADDNTVDLQVMRNPVLGTVDWIDFRIAAEKNTLDGSHMLGAIFEEGTTNLIAETRGGIIQCVN